MSEQIVAILKRKLDNLTAYGELDAETRRNVLKEELQFYVLNFIYHHPAYSNWIMYGGSALRIIYGLDRMSVDVDFEVPHAVTETFLDELKREIEEYFLSNYGAESEFVAVKVVSGRGLLVKFDVGDKLALGHPSTQIHVRIDLNHFVAPKAVTERRPINHGQLSFIIVTYNMSALMASKIAAIFLRGARGIGKATYEEKGRDIYDLLWYMNKKAVPDFDYLAAKGIDGKDPRALFDKLTLQMNEVSDENLKQDLLPLFTNQTYIQNWLANWRESYIRLLDEYKINTITEFEGYYVQRDFATGNLSFTFWYKTIGQGLVGIVYNLGGDWITSGKDLQVAVNEKVVGLWKDERWYALEGDMKGQMNEQLKRYVTLFHDKSEAYLKKTNYVMLGNTITTKLIRMTADSLNPKEQIVLNKSALLSCDLDDLMK